MVLGSCVCLPQQALDQYWGKGGQVNGDQSCGRMHCHSTASWGWLMGLYSNSIFNAGPWLSFCRQDSTWRGQLQRQGDGACSMHRLH